MICVSKSAPNEPKRRISSFNGRIFRNRKERSIKLMDDTDDVEKMDESETMDEEHTAEEYEEVPLNNQEGKENEEVKDKKVKEKIIEESLVRRLIRMMKIKKKEPVKEISYIKKQMSIELLIKNDEEKKKKEEIEEKKEEIVEDKIDKKEAILTGIKTEIGKERLPKKIIVVDTHEELAKPGTSKDYSKVIEELEKAELYKKKKENKVNEVMKDEGKDKKEKIKGAETKL
nr:hypothetical protein MACL_00002209 [Theileria orientalis]